jgi:hypothetical protein
MVSNSIRVVIQGVSTVRFFLFHVARFAGARERECVMAFMHCAHAKKYFLSRGVQTTHDPAADAQQRDRRRVTAT